MRRPAARRVPLAAVLAAAAAGAGAQLTCASQGGTCPGCRNVSALLSGLLAGYDPRVSPMEGAPPYSSPPARPTLVRARIAVLHSAFLDAAAQAFTATADVEEEWGDARLQWDPAEFCGRAAVDFLPEAAVWIPDTAVRGAARLAAAPPSALTLRNDGALLRSRRLTVTQPCPLDMTFVPFDTQRCTFPLGSYAYPSSVLAYRRAPGGTVAALRGNASELAAGMYEASHPVLREGTSTAGDPDAAFTGIDYEINFRRVRSAAVALFLVPQWLIVIFSFAGLWVHPAAWTARTLVAVAPLLALVLHMLPVQRAAPPGAAASGLDWLFLVSFFFCAFNALECCAVSHLLSAIAQREAGIALRSRARRRLAAEQEAGASSPHSQGPWVGCHSRHVTPAPPHGEPGAPPSFRLGQFPPAPPSARSPQPQRRAQLADLREAFALLDPLSSGRVLLSDVAAVMHAIVADHGYTACARDFESAARGACPEAVRTSGLLEFADFVAAVESAGVMEVLRADQPCAASVFGLPVTRSSVSAFEARYRLAAAALCVAAYALWAIALLAWNGRAAAGAVGASLIVVVAAAAFFALRRHMRLHEVATSVGAALSASAPPTQPLPPLQPPTQVAAHPAPAGGPSPPAPRAPLPSRW